MSLALKCNALTKNYGHQAALNNFSLELEKGRIVGLLGPNGSGKSTFIKLACGLLTPTSGELFIGEHAPGTETKKVVSYLPERACLPTGMKVKECIAFFKDFYTDFNLEKANGMLASLGLTGEQKINQMSKGTREKLQLVLTMSRDAELYLLDEPIGGVDPAARDFIMDTIIRNYSENSTIIISTHLITDIEKYLDDVVMINRGSLVLKSTVDEIREEKGISVDALFREVFKC